MATPFIRVAITPPYFYPGEAEAIADHLRERRFDYIHIRKPDATATEVRRLIEAIGPTLRSRLSVHYHHTIAADLSCGGIHLSSGETEIPAGWDRRISRSCHSIAELRQPICYDYLFLSPVFPSLSKPGYRSSILSDPLLPDALSASVSPIVALGGVTRSDFGLLASLGFKGAAMLGVAWRSEALNPASFRLQLITHPYPGRSVTESAIAALKGGCRWIQLRHKDARQETIASEAGAITALRDRFDFTFILDDHVELVASTGADGVHLGKNDMPVAEARHLLGPGKIIGATANTIDDIRRAARDGADYIGLGPLRFTSTKKNLSPILGIEGYREIISLMRAEGLRLPVVAIGGIGTDDISLLTGAGADGIAVSGAILGADDPAAATELFINELNNAEKK